MLNALPPAMISFLGARVDAVVANVAHPAQHDAVRKALRALVVARPELPEHREQGVADERVDLVDEKHEGLGIGLRPSAQHFSKHAVRAGAGQDIGPKTRQRLVLECYTRANCQLGEDGAHRLFHVLARRLAELDIGVHAAVVALAAAVQEVPEREEGGGLAGLARCVEHEVAFTSDQGQHVVEIEAAERRNAVVLVRADRSRGIEKAHGREYLTSGECAPHG